MIWAVALAAGALVAAGVHLALSRDLLRAAIGVSLLGFAANLIVLGAGRVGATDPPIVPDGTDVLATTAANPLPQALVLTAIVIGFSLTCFSLVLVLALKQRSGVADSTRLSAAEPPATADGKPPILDEVE